MKKTGTNKITKILLFLLIFITMPHLTFAQEDRKTPKKVSSVKFINDVADQFKAFKNKYGRVSITKFKPLSHQSRDKTFHLGISFLTQDDAIASPGVGAIFQF